MGQNSMIWGSLFYLTPTSNSINLLFILFHMSPFNRAPTDTCLLQTITVHNSLSLAHAHTFTSVHSVLVFSHKTNMRTNKNQSKTRETQHDTFLTFLYTIDAEFFVNSSESWFFLYRVCTESCNGLYKWKFIMVRKSP